MTPEAVDLERLEAGLLSLALDHDTTRLAGRIASVRIAERRMYAVAEIINTPTGRDTLTEIQAGVRRGFSPGFMFSGVRALRKDEAGYDEEMELQTVVTRWLPYEISSTAIPRNSEAILTNLRRGRASMTTSVLQETGAPPEIVSFDDPAGLTLAMMRLLAAQDSAPDGKIKKVSDCLSIFEEMPESEGDRETRLIKAMRQAGIPVIRRPGFPLQLPPIRR